MYTESEVMTFVHEEDVKFIRLAFFDLFGVQKNVSIMSSELERAFSNGILFDASSVAGFEDSETSDLFLFPDPSTIVILPWRPSDGKVVRMFCDIRYADGRPFEKDSRYILKQAVEKAKNEAGLEMTFGSKMEFYLTKLDEIGNPTNIPFDNAGYMDIAPEDKGENVRREICFTLERMGITPESSHHESGPGQNEVDFYASDALTAADNTETFKWVVRTKACTNGLYADFSPVPVKNAPGNSMHINISCKFKSNQKDLTDCAIAGILQKIPQITLFTNPTVDSYERFNRRKAPNFITVGKGNRSTLIRIPSVSNSSVCNPDESYVFEVRSPDTMANPYLVFALFIHAALEGIKNSASTKEFMTEENLCEESAIKAGFERIPGDFASAVQAATRGDFLNSVFGEKVASSILKFYAESPEYNFKNES